MTTSDWEREVTVLYANWLKLDRFELPEYEQDEDAVYPLSETGKIDWRTWIAVLESTDDLRRSIQERLCEICFCAKCGGYGGWNDDGPHPGCVEYGERHYTPCGECDGRGFIVPTHIDARLNPVSSST